MRGYLHEKELADRTETDHIFGALSQPGLVSIPLAEREKWLPIGELQNLGSEKSDCASRSPINHLEALFSYHYNNGMHPENKKWLEEKRYVQGGRVTFSDVFVSINSGTTIQGNSLIAPIQAIRKQGLIPKWMLPQLTFGTWESNANPKRITQEMRDLGAEFARRFTISYERVDELHLVEALKDDMVGVAGYAWPDPVNGVYPRIDAQPNHAFLLFNSQYWAFDNYLDNDGDFIKHLASDYDFHSTAYRIYLSAEDPTATAKQVSLYQQLIKVLLKIRDILRS